MDTTPTPTPGRPALWKSVPRGGYFSPDRYDPVDVTVAEVRGDRARVIAPLRNGGTVGRWVKVARLEGR
jgi:hypothetical protein